MSQQRRLRRQRLNKQIIPQLESLIRERDKLADSFLTHVDVTEAMMEQLEKKIYPDTDFQRNWDRFQDLQKRIAGLKETGGKMVELRENNRLSGGKFQEGLKEHLKKM